MLLASITISNTNTATGTPGLFGSIYSSVKDFAVVHPYITYAAVGVVIRGILCSADH